MLACEHASLDHALGTMPKPSSTPVAHAPGSISDHSEVVTTADAKSLPAGTENVPLQIRIPKHEARRIKVAAAERDQSISQFLLSCFHAYKK